MKFKDINQQYKLDVINQRENIVSKRNELIQKSRYSLPTQQQKILLYMISKIKPDDTIETLYTIGIKDFCAVCNIDCDSGTNYADVRGALKGFADKSVWIKVGRKEVLHRWLNEVKIDEKGGTIEFSFHKSMEDYLFGLEKGFTEYPLINVLCMKSKYSIRLYETLKSYANMPKQPVFIPLPILKRCLDAENYTTFVDFRRRAFEPAIKEIQQYNDNIKIEWEFVRGKGREYTGLSVNIISLPDDSIESATAFYNRNEKLR